MAQGSAARATTEVAGGADLLPFAAWAGQRPLGTAPGAPSSSGAELLLAVTHDLRAPLTSLTTASELLAEDVAVLDRDQIRRMAFSIHRSALWLQGLVENLVCAATVQEGGFRIQPRPLSLLDVALELEPVLGPLLAQKGLRLRVASRGAPAEVCADGRRIGQVLVNLISNAVAFAREGTSIQVTISARPGAVRVSVADRGPGLPPGAAGRVFEAFYRAAGSEHDGVGLGLAIVKWVVEAHGGRVGAGNRRGGGACFWFELPLPAAGAGSARGTER